MPWRHQPSLSHGACDWPAVGRVPACDGNISTLALASGSITGWEAPHCHVARRPPARTRSLGYKIGPVFVISKLITGSDLLATEHFIFFSLPRCLFLAQWVKSPTAPANAFILWCAHRDCNTYNTMNSLWLTSSFMNYFCRLSLNLLVWNLGLTSRIHRRFWYDSHSELAINATQCNAIVAYSSAIPKAAGSR